MSSPHVQIPRTGEIIAPKPTPGATRYLDTTKPIIATVQDGARAAVVATTTPPPRPSTGRYTKEQLFEYGPPEIVQEVLIAVNSIPHCKELAPDTVSSLVHHIALLAKENRDRILENLPSLITEQILALLEALKLYLRKHPSETGIITKLLERIQNPQVESPRQ